MRDFDKDFESWLVNDFAESYHKHQMSKELEKWSQQIDETFVIGGFMSNSKQEEVMAEKRGANWLLNHLRKTLEESLEETQKTPDQTSTGGE